MDIARVNRAARGQSRVDNTGWCVDRQRIVTGIAADCHMFDGRQDHVSRTGHLNRGTIDGQSRYRGRGTDIDNHAVRGGWIATISGDCDPGERIDAEGIVTVLTVERDRAGCGPGVTKGDDWPIIDLGVGTAVDCDRVIITAAVHGQSVITGAAAAVDVDCFGVHEINSCGGSCSEELEFNSARVTGGSR